MSSWFVAVAVALLALVTAGNALTLVLTYLEHARALRHEALAPDPDTWSLRRQAIGTWQYEVQADRHAVRLAGRAPPVAWAVAAMFVSLTMLLAWPVTAPLRGAPVAGPPSLGELGGCTLALLASAAAVALATIRCEVLLEARGPVRGTRTCAGFQVDAWEVPREEFVVLVADEARGRVHLVDRAGASHLALVVGREREGLREDMARASAALRALAERPA